MKVILNYKKYYSFGRQYQVKFLYESEQEKEKIKKLIDSHNDNNLIKPRYYDSNINVISEANIPKEILLSFINILIEDNNSSIMIGDYYFSTFEEDKIQEAINKLHVNAFFDKGIYLNSGQTYYVIFKYSNDEQRDEMLYDYYTTIMPMSAEFSKEKNENMSKILPFLVDRTGSMTIRKNGIIGGSNIPDDLLEILAKRFIEKHDVILNVGTEKFIGVLDTERFNYALSTLDHAKTKIRRKESI